MTDFLNPPTAERRVCDFSPVSIDRAVVERSAELMATLATLCLADPGITIVGTPLFCQLPQAHEGKHVGENGGRASWGIDDAGRTVNAAFEGFVFRG